MRDRLMSLRELLSEDGSIFVTIDFNETHYLKVLMDEVFGRKNFQREIIWRIGWLSGFKTKAKNFIRNHDTILYYSKNKEVAYFNKQYIQKSEFPPRFSNQSVKEICDSSNKKGLSNDHAREIIDLIQDIGLPDRYPLEDTWNCSIYDRLNSIAVVSFSGESVSKMLGVEDLKGQKSEALVRRVLEACSKPGDLVLDSFAGTGTTAAVAHKMRRRWINIEIGDHAQTHIVPRLKLIVDGKELSGITKVTGWKGGGGYRFYRLAPSLLKKDDYGHWIISKNYNPAMLAEAMCKHMGFTYAPSDEDYWNHGYAHDQSHIYVTTNRLTYDYLDKVASDVGSSRNLLICCKAFEGKVDGFENLTVTKIPQVILDKCEWNKDDYSLNVKNLPMAASMQVSSQPGLFDHEGEDYA